MNAICVIVCFKASECPVDHIITIYNSVQVHSSSPPSLINQITSSIAAPSPHFKHSLVNQLSVYLVLTLVLLLIFWSYFLLLMLLQFNSTLSHSPGKKKTTTIFNISNCMRRCNLFILGGVWKRGYDKGVSCK